MSIRFCTAERFFTASWPMKAMRRRRALLAVVPARSETAKSGPPSPASPSVVSTRADVAARKPADGIGSTSPTSISSISRETTSAKACMSSSCCTKALRLVRAPRAVFASVGAAGSSVHGWMISAFPASASLRMMSPEAVPCLFVAKPLMWSLCRCVATTASSFPPVTSAMSLAMVTWKSLSVPGGSVEPKSIRTCRCSFA